MESVISAAEGVKKRTRSSSKTPTTSSASKKTKTAPGPFSPAQSSQPLAPRTSRSRAPASASVYGQAPYEGEPSADHVTSPLARSSVASTTRTAEEGDSVSERSLSPPHIPATRLDIPASLDIPTNQELQA